MFVLTVILTVLLSLSLLAWISRHFRIWRERRTGFSLDESYPIGPGDPPFISVLVAAKDEAGNIERCVRTMLEQDYPNFEMIVCNDRSADDTAAIVERIAAEDDRVRLINIDHLPDGWCGKNHAMQHGIGEAKGDWICMIDADCRQTSTRTLSVAMQYALDNDAELLSILPILEMIGFWENVVQPVCGGIMMIWFNPDKVNDPHRPHAYANGAFMLIRRRTYEAIGRHEAVRMCFNEDIHMAARVKGRGHRLRVVRSHGLYLVRMYTSLRQIVSGWGRIFFGTFGSAKRLVASLAALLVMGLLPYVACAVGLSLGLAGVAPARWWLACGILGAAAATMQLTVIYRFYKLIYAQPRLAWTYALGNLIACVALIVALTKLRSGAKVTWRSTSYSSTTPD